MWPMAGRQPHTSKLVVWLTEQGREEKGQKQETTAKTIGRQWTERDTDVSSSRDRLAAGSSVRLQPLGLREAGEGWGGPGRGKDKNSSPDWQSVPSPFHSATRETRRSKECALTCHLLKGVAAMGKEGGQGSSFQMPLVAGLPPVQQV